MKKNLLTAAIAVLAMAMASVTVTSCGDDDDEDGDSSSVTVDTKTFTVKMGGASSEAGSFLSISSEKAYTTSSLGDGADVEIVFDGTTFKSATESANSKVSANGKSATITAAGANSFAYVTSNGYTGTITANATLGDAAKTYTITVTKVSK